jgi:hypothetical protein
MLKTLREWWLDWIAETVLVGLFNVAVGGSRAAYTASALPGSWLSQWCGFLENSAVEMFGAFMMFVLLELIRGKRERQAQEQAAERRTKATQELVRNFAQAPVLARLSGMKTLDEQQPVLGSMPVYAANTDWAFSELVKNELFCTYLGRKVPLKSFR